MRGGILEYLDSYAQSRTHAESALEHMEKHGITPNPTNFQIWYSYVAGRNKDLIRAMDILIGNDQEFTDALCLDLYEQFFNPAQQSKELAKTTASIDAQLCKVVEILDKSGEDTAEYGKALSEIGGQLDGDFSIEQFQLVVESLVAATNTIETQNQSLQAELKASSSQITRLHQDLENVRRETITDPLTGVANRKGFDEHLRLAATESMESGQPLCLIMCDIDHFKKVNDTWGHQLGDQVLRLVAKTLTANVKGRDTVARYGGEEFVVILPNTELSDAGIVANDIRKSVASKRARKKSSGETIGRITLSFGVSQFEPGEPLENFIKRADGLLYAAKDAGRNRVICEGDAPLAPVDATASGASAVSA
jgi:diguanylate cyclase